MKGIVGQTAVVVSRTGTTTRAPSTRRATTVSPTLRTWRPVATRRGAAVTYAAPRIS